jgi:glycosyltransferase involved in cell wall biosynthesis
MNVTRKTIGLINSMEQGGAERQMLFLLESGVVSEIITLSHEKFFDEGMQNITSLSKNANNLSRYIRPLLIPWYVYKLSRKISRGDVVISFAERSNFVNILSNVFTKHKTIISIRTNPDRANKGLKWFQKQLMKLLYPYADRVVTNSQGVADFLVRNYRLRPKKVTVISNAYNLESIKNQSQEKLEYSDEQYFKHGQVCIAVGRLAYPKGFRHLVNAFKYVHDAVSDAKLIIMGEGRERTLLEDLIKKNNLTEVVYLMGARKNPFSLIAKSKLLVLSSRWEGMPNVIVESLICGTPVVSVDCDFGPRDILNDHVGVITPAMIQPFDTAEHALAQSIVDVLQGEKKFPAFEIHARNILEEKEYVRVADSWKKLCQ